MPEMKKITYFIALVVFALAVALIFFYSTGLEKNAKRNTNKPYTLLCRDYGMAEVNQLKGSTASSDYGDILVTEISPAAQGASTTAWYIKIAIIKSYPGSNKIHFAKYIELRFGKNKTIRGAVINE